MDPLCGGGLVVCGGGNPWEWCWEVEVPQRAFNRRIQPFAIALAEVLLARKDVYARRSGFWRPSILKSPTSFSPWHCGRMRTPRGVCLKDILKSACARPADPTGRVRLCRAD